MNGYKWQYIDSVPRFSKQKNPLAGKREKSETNKNTKKLAIKKLVTKSLGTQSRIWEDALLAR